MRIHEKSHLLEKQNGEYVSAKQSQPRLKWDYNIENLIKCIQRVQSKKNKKYKNTLLIWAPNLFTNLSFAPFFLFQ